MPIPKTYYQCEHCPNVFTNRKDCIEHECKYHLHISIEDYKKLQQLEQAVKKASRMISVTKNQQTEEAYDKAINDLITFEKNINNKGGKKLCKHFAAY